jgi:serine/threonine-protein kinase
LQKDRLRRHALLALKIGALGAVLTGVAAFSAYLTVRRSVSGRTVHVPDLTSLSLEAATAALREKGLLLEEAAQRNDEIIEAGKILAQDPPPGADIKMDRKVKVVLSLGNQVSTIPDLRGGAARKAQITLQQQGMTLGDQVYVATRRAGENVVIAQDPLPQSAGLREARVAILVSRGTPTRTWVMPDLTGRTEAEVTTFLGRAGLRLGPVRRDSGSTRPGGTIVAQTPPSGYPVNSTDVVMLTVAGGD